LVFVVVSLVAACGDEDDNGTCEVEGGAACFELPTAVIETSKMGAATTPNFSCAKLTATNSTQSVTLSGTAKHYTNGNGLPGLAVEYHSSTAFGTPLASGTTDADGAFSITLPSGTPNLLHLKATGSAILPAYFAYLKYDLTMPAISMLDYRGPTPDLLDTIETLVRVDAQDGKAVLALTVVDCDAADVEHAVVTISSTSKTATHVPGINVFYGPPGAFPIPIMRSEQAETNDNGSVAVLNVTPGATLYAQAWGFLDAAAMGKGTSGLKLIAEWPVPVFADAAVGAILRPSEGPL
jgi:hypothetical protein